jgi:GDPmannose 4,6-dehydratase
VGNVDVKIDLRYFRPTGVETLLEDSTKAENQLGWSYEITLQQTCAEMVASYLGEAEKNTPLKKYGFQPIVSFK